MALAVTTVQIPVQRGRVEDRQISFTLTVEGQDEQ
jgi:hypothetical protein